MRVKKNIGSGKGPAALPRVRPLVIALLAAGVLAPAAQALPTGEQVKSGVVEVMSDPKAGVMNISQSSDKAIIDWKTFNISPGETVEIDQYSSQAVLLNRVNSSEPSYIEGILNAFVNVNDTRTLTGRVFLVNPYGIVFGNGAQVNVGALIATTANISDADFLAGQYRFTGPGSPTAQIFNAGTINVSSALQNGLVALVAPAVRNQGVIRATVGKVTLASGNTFTAVDLFGDGLIRFAAGAEVTGMMEISALVDQTGTITNDGGRVVLMTAGAAKGIVDTAINMSGVIRARSAQQYNGSIVLQGAGGAVDVSGTLDVSDYVPQRLQTNLNQNFSGGMLVGVGAPAAPSARTIQVTGDTVRLTGEANLNASGAQGGGTVLIGGDFQGQGSLYRSSYTNIGSSVLVNASALTAGNGGNVAVWSNGNTDFHGAIQARGGATSGNGGYVDVSAKGRLGFYGTVDVGAPNGTAGTLIRISGEDRAKVVGKVNSSLIQSIGIAQSSSTFFAPLPVITTLDVVSLFDDETDLPVIGAPPLLTLAGAGGKSGKSVFTGYGILPPEWGGYITLPIMGHLPPGAGSTLQPLMGHVPPGGGSTLQPLMGHMPPGALGPMPGPDTFGSGMVFMSGHVPPGAGGTGSTSLPMMGHIPSDAGPGGTDLPAAPGTGPLVVATVSEDGGSSIGGAAALSAGKPRSRSKDAMLVRQACGSDASRAGSGGAALAEIKPGAASGKSSGQGAGSANACAPAGGALAAGGNQGVGSLRLTSGGRGVAQIADLGRGNPLSGATPDVFRVAHHIVTAPRFIRGLGARNNYFCTNAFGDNVCAQLLAQLER